MVGPMISPTINHAIHRIKRIRPILQTPTPTRPNTPSEAPTTGKKTHTIIDNKAPMKAPTIESLDHESSPSGPWRNMSYGRIM